MTAIVREGTAKVKSLVTEWRGPQITTLSDPQGDTAGLFASPKTSQGFSVFPAFFLVPPCPAADACRVHEMVHMAWRLLLFISCTTTIRQGVFDSLLRCQTRQPEPIPQALLTQGFLIHANELCDQAIFVPGRL